MAYAPEKIWVSESKIVSTYGDYPPNYIQSGGCPDGPEYTRSDLIPQWDNDMDAAKREGVVIIECYVNGNRLVSTGGWDSHWSGECWVYDNQRIPAGTIPTRWMRAPPP